jgi:hypothetical protein
MSSVRARRMISGTTTAILLVSAACTTSGSNPPRSLPKPKGDEVIILAGNGTAGKPRPGAFATQTPLTNPNAMAFSPADGALLVAADTQSQEAIVRIGTDGRVSVLETDLYGPMRAMGVGSANVWTLWPTPARNAASYSALYRQSLSGEESAEFFGGYGTSVALTLVDRNGARLPGTAQRQLSQSWYPMGLFVQAKGSPIVTLADGRLFEALGESKIRAFDPVGYGTALETVGGKLFSAMALVSDNKGGFVVIGPTGAIWVPANGAARGTRFHSQIPPAVYKGWYREWGATVLGNGDLLITSQGRLYQVGNGGMVTIVPTNRKVNCRATKKLSEFGVPARTRLTRLPDGTIAMSAVNQCNRVYAFRLPNS